MKTAAQKILLWFFACVCAGFLASISVQAQAPAVEWSRSLAEKHEFNTFTLTSDGRIFTMSTSLGSQYAPNYTTRVAIFDPFGERIGFFTYRGYSGEQESTLDSRWSPRGFIASTGRIHTPAVDAFIRESEPSGDIFWRVSSHHQTSGGFRDDFGQNVAVDSAGYVYVLGEHDGELILGDKSIDTGAESGVRHVFLTRLTAAGSVDWLIPVFKDSITSYHPLDLDVDPAGNALACIATDAGPALMRFDAAGTQVWRRDPAALSTVRFRKVLYAGDGTFFAAGTFSGATIFATDSLHSAGGTDGIVAHFSADAGLIDYWIFGGPNDDRIDDFVRDGDDNLFILGTFDREITLAGSTFQADSTDNFLLSTGVDFSPRWVMRKGDDFAGFYKRIAVDSGIVWAGGDLAVPGDPSTWSPRKDSYLVKYSWQHAPEYSFVDDFESGSAAAWGRLTPSRWAVARDYMLGPAPPVPNPTIAEHPDLALHLNTSDITNTGEGLGEYTVLSGLLFRDFDLYAHVRSPEDLAANTFADYAVLLGYRDAENYDYVLFSAKKDESRVYRLQNGTRTALAQLDDTTIEDNNYHYIRLQRSGDTLSVWFDNRLAATVQDTGFSAGRIGFGSFNDEAWFDQVRIAGAAVRLDVGVSLPDTSVVFSDTLALPVLVSSDNPLGFAQVTLEYDSTLVDILDVAPGAATADFTFVLNRDVPFAPEHAGANANVLLQFSNSVGFSGADQEIAVLQVRSRIDADSLTGIWLDRRQPHTSFVTSDTGIEIDSSQTSFDDAALSLLARRFAISGSVKYLQSGEPISATVLHLDHLSGSSADTSDSAGAYLFPAVRADSVRLAAEKQDDQREAITGADALLSLRTLAFLDSLSPAGLSTADVNENGSLTGSDAVALLRYLAFLPVAVGNPGVWRFEPPDSSFLLQNDAAVDFTGRLLGDVNLDWGSSTGAGKDTAANGRLQQTVADLRLPALVASLGDTLSLPVALSSDSGFSLLQFTLAYDSQRLQFLGARAGEATAGMTLLVNAEPPFAPQAQGVDRSLVVQFSSATDTVRGEDQIIAWLDMRVAGEVDSGTVALLFDSAPERTFLTTVNYSDITAQQIQLIDGSVDITVGVQGPAGRPEAFALLQNYPNPFNPETEIRYALPRPSAVRLSLFNLTGQQVRVLVDAAQPAGWHRVRWDGRDSAGKRLPSGFYFYHLQADGFSATRRLLLLR